MSLFFILSIVIQVILIVHVIKTGRNTIWIWVLALLSIPGAIAYLVAGRPAPTLDGSSGVTAGGGDAARRAVDALYSPRDRR